MIFHDYSRKLERQLKVDGEEALQVMRKSLTEIYLSTRDFESMERLYKDGWEKFVLDGPVHEWELVLSTENDDYFIPKNAYNHMRETIREKAKRYEWSGRTFNIELSRMVQFYIQTADEYNVLCRRR